MSQGARTIITMLTDFGLSDSYVAAMKGVILGICRQVRLVDVTHLVPPQQVSSGAYLLASCYRDFPPGTIHLVVVDPGVGSARKPLAIGSRNHTFVGPDNGIFSLVLDREKPWQARAITNPKLCRTPLSTTFHGRDLFAPTAAHLADGFPFEQIGPLCQPLRPDWQRVLKAGPTVLGRIIHIDHFGNAVTSISADHLAEMAEDAQPVVELAGIRLQVHAIYAEVAPGIPLALIGSSGYLEVSVHRGSASERLGLEVGNEVRLVA